MDWVARALFRVSRVAPALIALAGVTAAAFDADAQVQRPDKRGSYYEVRIDSSPQGATLYLDDKNHGEVGTTPWEGRLQQGEWTVILEKEGYEREEQPFRVVRTRQLQEAFLTLDQAEQPSVLSVTADNDPSAAGAVVIVNGEEIGEVPASTEVAEGRHLVELRQDGFEDYREWVRADDGEDVRLAPVLEEEGTGQILVQADAPDARVYLDGEEVTGELPLLIEDVRQGVRDLEVVGDDGTSWEKGVEVSAGETAEVRADLLGDEGGLRVLSDVRGATVYIDGVEVGEVPLELDDVRPGEHVVEVAAEGYESRDERIDLEPGQSKVIQLDLEAIPADRAFIEVVSPVPGARVIINGELVGESPVTREVSAGEHFVVVSKEGYRDFEGRIDVEPGEERLVTADLQAVGEIRFVSNPSGAEVYIDGEPAGVTPFTADEVPAGERVVMVRKQGYESHEHRVSVEGGGSETISSTLPAAQPTQAEIEREVRGLTSFGARTLPPGRSTVDVAGGYPYFLDGRITVGADEINDLGFDAGVFARTFFSRTEVGAMGRLRMVEEGPFSFGGFAQLGGGGNFFDDSSRNTFFTDFGAVASLTALRYVTISGRLYLNAYTDRHCPEPEGGTFPPDSDPVSTCEEYHALQNGDPSDLSSDDVRRIERMIDDPFSRDSGVRGMISGVVEFAVEQRWNVWMVFEGAPFQSPRAGYTSYFNRPMFDRDIGTYMRFGATLKF